MARMIPAAISEDTKSSAERKVFRSLQCMPDTADWIVMHSVAIAKHPTQSQGEGDFVVLIPDMGIFVLEVKGGAIRYNEGKWYSRDRYDVEHDIKDPGKEAGNAMFALKQFVEQHNEQHLELSLFGFGVVFPDSIFHGKFVIPDIDDDQIADNDDMGDIRSYLLRLAKFWKTRKTPNIVVPHKDRIDTVASLLRPVFNYNVALAGQIRNVEKQVVTLTQNQQETFEMFAENDRCLVQGYAGTGKTLLAVAKARQWAAEGKRTGLFCYNRMLADWLQRNTMDVENITCGSLSDHMMLVTERMMSAEHKRILEENKSSFYRDVLPMMYMEALIDGTEESYDCLILDEAQDLLDEKTFEVLDLMLKGGLNSGKWICFLDAEMQNIYRNNIGMNDIDRYLHSYNAYYTKCRLTDNCRNSPAIIEKIDDIFGTKTHQRPTENKGAEVRFLQYNRGKNQADKLESLLHQITQNGVSIEEITVLSTLRYERSCISELSEIPVSRDPSDRSGRILFSTIHSFKGMESSVVILTDIDALDYDHQKMLLYIGMTRARSALCLVASEKARKTIDDMTRSVVS